MRMKGFITLVAFAMVLTLLGGCNSEGEASAKEDEQLEIYQGLGVSKNFRLGPGKDSEGEQVYSFNYVMASGIFDEEGRIVDIYVDGLEVSTPNYDGASMPHFSGWPGTEGINVTDHDT